MAINQAKNTNTNELLKAIITIIKSHKNILAEVADYYFLNYIFNIDDYITGTNGENYGLILHNDLKTDKRDLNEFWTILLQLIWNFRAVICDLVYSSCQGDYLAYYADKSYTHLYESCLGCFLA